MRTPSILLSLALALAPGRLLAADHYVALNWHDVDRGVVSGSDRAEYAIDARRLAEEFDWMSSHGYHPVSIQQILDAHAGRSHLPHKAVLLTFDDGLESFYTRVFPLLQAYHWPALLAINSKWADEASTRGTVDYGGTRTPASRFLTWRQIARLHRSPLVEIAAHGRGLHHGILGNPQGNKAAAAVARRYDPTTGRYETGQQWETRVRSHLAAGIRDFRRHLGWRPRVMVWPYGANDHADSAIARSLGYVMDFTARGVAPDNSVTRLRDIDRDIVENDPDLQDFVGELQSDEDMHGALHIQRAAMVSLDRLYTPDPKRFNKRLGRLLDRIQTTGVNTVYLQAYSTGRDGRINGVWFPNSILPVRGDIFNRVMWQLNTRSGVNVYAVLPDARVAAAIEGRCPSDPGSNPEVPELFDELGAAAPGAGAPGLNGLVVDQSGGGCPPRDNRQMDASMKAISRAIHPYTYDHFRFVRLLDAQQLERLKQPLPTGERVAVRLAVGAKNPERLSALLRQLVELQRARHEIAQTVFLLPARTTTGAVVPASRIRDWMRELTDLSARNFGYATDDGVSNVPDLDPLRSAVSLKTTPIHLYLGRRPPSANPPRIRR